MSSIQNILGQRRRISLFVALCAVVPACSSDDAEPSDAGNAGTGGDAGNAGTTSEAGASGTAGDGAGAAGSASEGGSSGAAGGGSEGGSSGTAGITDGGAAGDDAAGGQGGAPSVRSSGCNKDVIEPFDNWTTHDITVTVDPEFVGDGYGERRYFTRPPVNYDPNVAYPVTIWGQGCGQSEAEASPLMLGPAADNSIQVELLAKGTPRGRCYSAGPDGDNANSPELPYFDLVLAQVEDAFCIDKSKVFVGGYSSGGWLSGLISCNRTDVVRGVGWAAAGLQLNHAECTGPVAAIITRGMGDGGTPLDQTLAARDSILMRNGCSMDTLPWNPPNADFDNSSCLEYQGCMPGYPVVWCPTPGQHSNGLDTGLSSKGFWALWSSLP